MSFSLRKFIKESNRIEGIHKFTESEVKAAEHFLEQPKILVSHLNQFVWEIAKAKLRDQVGMDVRVGNHVPISGGITVRTKLIALLQFMDDKLFTPYEVHLRYETLHPFMDGNGRSGRLLWLWCMSNRCQKVHNSSFLHTWYYQSLDDERK
jgi:hypothetical protein